MIFTIEKRTVSGGGTVETHYEARRYEGRTAIGILKNGKTLKCFKKKSDARDYFGRKGIVAEEL